MSDLVSAEKSLSQQAAHPLVGTWRTIETSDAIQDGATTSTPIEGFFIFTPAPDARLAVLYGSVDSGDAPAANSYKLAYTGRWTADGDAIEVDIDFSTNKFITGTFTRFFAIEGTKLTLRTPLHESKATPGVRKVTSFTFTRA